MRPRIRTGMALSFALLLGVSGLAVAHDSVIVDDGVVDSGKEIHGIGHHQHGGVDGHITADNYGANLVSKLELTGNDGAGKIADVAVWNGFAYLGRFRQDACGGNEGGSEPDGGAYVVDVRDPANPKKVGFLPVFQDSFVGEGVQALTITTPKFSGDLLALNSESCGKNDKGGFTLYDVTNPLKARKLTENAGDANVSINENGKDANDIHSVFVWEDENGTVTNADDRAYIVTTDDFELTDVDIFDITDPRHPFLVGEFDLDARYPGIIDPTLGPASGFLHDMVVKEIGVNEVMLLSYWDSGYVMLNVNDPANPTLIADTDYLDPDPLSGERPEGNGHYAEFAGANDEYVVATDEDFGPYAIQATNIDDATDFNPTSGSDTPPLAAGDTIAGDTVYLGLACSAAGLPAGVGAQIALVERGVCTFQEKHDAVVAAGGYLAMIVFSREGSDACTAGLTMLLDGTLQSFFVGRDVGFAMLDLAYDNAACLAGNGTATAPVVVGTVADSVSIASTFDGWGYVRLFSTSAVGGKLPELDQYAIPEAFDSTKADGFGDLSVHEVATSAVDKDRVYVSYYAGGLRILEIQGNQLVEVAAYIDATGDSGNNFWGVQVFQSGGKEYVAASDRDYGLYIFEYDPAD